MASARRRGRPAAIQTPFVQFERELKEASSLYGATKPFSRRGRLPKKYSSVGLTSAAGRMTLGLAFLRVMGAWEQFQDEVFFRIMVGTATLSGATFAIATPPPHATIASAFQAVHPKQAKANRMDHFLSWTDWNTTHGRARRHLAAGNPFVTKLVIGSDEETWVKYGTWVRNHVAHQSPQSVTRFRSAARGLLGGPGFPYKSFSPADLLMQPAALNFPGHAQGKDFFGGFVVLLRALARDLIA